MVVYVADEGIGLYGLDPEWSDLRARLLDRCAATGLSPWQIATRALEAYLGDV